MKFRQTNINLVYPRIEDYRRKFVLAEDSIKNQFSPAAILPIPDEVVPEVPRITAKTLHGHSDLNIALTVATFSTVYDGEFLTDWEKCEKYLSGRWHNVFHMVNELTGGNNSYIGLISNVEYDQLKDDSLQTLKENLLCNRGERLGDLKDVVNKLTYIIDHKYYLNITLSSQHNYTVRNTDKGQQLFMPDEGSFVGVTLDVNDRYAANTQEGYVSDEYAFTDILRITTKVIGNLDALILKGYFSYDTND